MKSDNGHKILDVRCWAELGLGYRISGHVRFRSPCIVLRLLNLR